MIDFRAPWQATGWENLIVNTADGNTIACAPCPRRGATLPEIQAFARLIAAAPELLAALETLTKLAQTIPQPANHEGLQLVDALAAARRAVAKATRETHETV